MVLKLEKNQLLKRYFGHSEFRRGQEKLVDALLSGRDVLGVMPTGAGKSICYQLPALMLPGITVVVSPLISLMKDQVTALNQAGIPAAYINSTLTESEYGEVFRQAQTGAYKLLYVAPERLLTQDFLRLSEQVHISLLAVDEAHCVSQWGQDFRPHYLDIGQFLNTLAERPVVGAFTATATAEVKTDIEKLLFLRDPLRVTTGFDRPNLYFEVVRPANKNAWIKHFLTTHPGQSGIIYCATRKTVEALADKLAQDGIPTARYHAGLEDEERKKNHEDFVYDRARIMVATNAFGMGIDKSNVNFVIHYNMPKNIESYYQEAGRAGRDGEKAHCALLFSNGDIQTARFFINSSADNEQLSDAEREQLRQNDLARLEQMVGYCKTTDCLRAYLLRYFGEETEGSCQNCGSCNGEFEQKDITIAAQKILSGIARAERLHPYGLGIAVLIKMLHGSKEQRIQELRLDTLTTYGALKETPMGEIREYIDFLLDEGYLMQTEGEYPVLHLTERAKEVLFRGETVSITRRKRTRAEKASTAKSAAEIQPDDELFEALRTLRFELASEAGVPAYLVFSNAALADMSAKKPQTMEEFLQVSGVGEVKAARYGDVFLQKIREWMSKEQTKI